MIITLIVYTKHAGPGAPLTYFILIMVREGGGEGGGGGGGEGKRFIGSESLAKRDIFKYCIFHQFKSTITSTIYCLCGTTATINNNKQDIL